MRIFLSNSVCGLSRPQYTPSAFTRRFVGELPSHYFHKRLLFFCFCFFASINGCTASSLMSFSAKNPMHAVFPFLPISLACLALGQHPVWTQRPLLEVCSVVVHLLGQHVISLCFGLNFNGRGM